MNIFIKFYNQNKYVIWISIIIIIAIISLIQLANKIVREQDIHKDSNNNIIISNNINKNYSVITGQEVKNEMALIIEKFVDFCNNKQIEEAYKLLSDECKNILYPTLNDFEKNYYNRIFKEKKTYFYQSWITNYNLYTYKVDFVNDMLATGEASKTSITDYYTVVKNEDEYKLNINKFIKNELLDKTVQKNDIKISLKDKNVYLDYEVYDIEVINDTEYEITLDSLKQPKTVYIQDESEQKYSWNNNEISPNDTSISTGNYMKKKIKFYKSYNSLAESKKIVFSDININNNEKISIEISL